jgi:hypothetical protein
VFRSYEPNQRTEARGLEKRHKGKSKCMDEDGDKVGTEARIKARMRIRMEVRAKAEWVPSIYLAVINE